MEQLSLLQKIYLYGETLSSEELNQIVLYLNSSIEAINTLIARNNNINEGHCEMRYKVSAQLPEAPESGTDGKSNGWSDTYTKPDTANGEITWMTLSFFNGEGVYGAWSTPVCITWGSVRGQAGPKGESGLKGSFKSRVFKRLNTRPDTPTGGTYDNPIPSEGDWTDGIPSGAAIIWSSVCTFYGNGLSSGWSIPAPESDSDTLDIEFSPNAVQPEPPTGDTPFTNHESEGWYDPSSNNFNIVGTMIWRAERKVSNGEYNGDWTITRIVGEKGERGESGLTGGHYEFRYNNFKPSEQASAPTKPSNGSNGTTGGWTTSQETLTETLIKEGYATWMTQCYQNEASTYGIWTDPIRITGANGYDGADGIDIEFVYTKNNTGATPPTPPTTVIDDWPRHTDEHGNVVDHVTIGDYVWYDNPQGVDENMMYEFVSLRTKVDDVWSAYSPPVIWSKWGEKGMDGDGFEYIYKRFQTVQNWASITGDDNPANWKTNHSTEFLDTREYLGPTGKEWNDDPQGIDETYKYEYVSVRLEIDGVWYGYSTPTLWSGMPGVFLSRVFTRTNDDISNVTPSGGTYANPIPNNTVVGSGQNQKTYVWSDSIPSGEAIIWSSTCVFNGDGSSNGWSKPLKESDTANLDIEFTDANSANGSAAPAAPSGNTPFSDHSSETPAWYDPSSIPANKTMVWRAERKVANGVYDGNWVITRIKGEKGEAGTKGNFKSTCFKRTNTDISGTTPTGGTYDSPVATGWSDGIPSGTAKVWATSCIFYGAGGKSAWSTPRPMTDTDTYDVEFAKMLTNDATPADPDDTNRHGGSGTQIWFDPVNDSSEDFTAMYWRAERECKNGVWGSWTIVRIKGEKGDPGTNGGNYEFRYKNATSATAPTAGTSGTTDDWSTTLTSPSESDLKSGIYTWMTYCYKSYTGTYGTWSTPVRITGANGYEGADGSDVEFIYHRDSSATAPNAPTASHSSNSKVFSADDWFGKDSNGVEWTDNPVGVTSTEKYEYVAVREKPAGKNQSWGVYHVALWSKWGEKGMDGDGYEYIFKLSTTKITSWSTDSNDYSNPANWPITDVREYYGPYSGNWPQNNNNPKADYRWSDDPLEVDDTNKYLYMSTRQRIDGHWLAFTTPVLWNNYAEAAATVPGPPGDIGPMSYLAGIWNENTTYTKTEKANPVVYYADNDNYYYLKDVGSSTGDNPAGTGMTYTEQHPNPWLQAENYNMVFTDILFVNDFAKLGSFIVNWDWMISQYGIIYDSSGTAHKIDSDSASWTNSGVTYVGKVSTSGLQPAYSLFDPYHPNTATKGATPGSTPNFVPYAAINAKTGESYFNKTHITGEVIANSGTFTGVVNATSGSFNGDVYANNFRAGDPLGFNITVGADSIDFNYGSNKQAWFSTKKLQMNSNGVIEDSGNDAPQGFYLYMISPKTGNVVTIDFESGKFVEVTNGAQVEVHSTTIPQITAGSSGTATVSKKIIYYKNQDTNGNSIPNKYYWDSECTQDIGQNVGNNCYIATKQGYVVMVESVLGRSPYTLRAVTIYLPAMYVALTGRIVGSGNSIFLVDYSSNNSNLKFAIPNASTAYTLYNSSVYYADSGTTLDQYTSVLRIASGTSSVLTFIAEKSISNTIPTASGNKISVFTATGSSPMSKFDYTV